jgi:2-iminobutanoate/2-iminopropanoate deaminase
MRIAVPLVVLLLALPALAQRMPNPPARFVNPPGLAEPTGYSHVVEVIGGRTIYIAGQVALDQSGKVVGPGDFKAQARQVLENLKVALSAGGATFRNVVKVNTYVTDMSQVQALRDLRAEYFTGNLPASTLVQVQALARPEFLLEIEAIAVVPEGVAVRPVTDGR